MFNENDFESLKENVIYTLDENEQQGLISQFDCMQY